MIISDYTTGLLDSFHESHGQRVERERRFPVKDGYEDPDKKSLDECLAIELNKFSFFLNTNIEDRHELTLAQEKLREVGMWAREAMRLHQIAIELRKGIADRHAERLAEAGEDGL